MLIKDVFLPLIGQPRAPVLAAIERCVAVAADLGARITALALEEDAFVRPKVVYPDDPESAEPGAIREAGDMQHLLSAFTNAASRSGIRARSLSGRVPADQIGSTFAEHARFSDLTLLPVNPHDSQTESIIETFLFESGRPRVSSIISGNMGYTRPLKRWRAAAARSARCSGAGRIRMRSTPPSWVPITIRA